MSPIVKGAALLFGSSTLSLVIWFLATKAWTVMVGPTGLGLISLYQNVVALATMAAGLGVGVGVVRLGAGDATRLAVLRRAAWLIVTALGGVVIGLVWGLRGTIAQGVFAGTLEASGVAWLAPAIAFGLAAGLQTGLLSAHRQVAALARMNLSATALGVGASIALIAAAGAPAIPAAVVAIYATTWLVSRLLMWWHLDRPSPPPPVAPAAVWPAMLELVRFGLPYTASMMVGAGVVYALPVLVLHGLGSAAVGFQRAASLIADHALGGIAAVMAQEYYPRLADRQTDAVAAINQQQRLMFELALPAVLGLYGLSPWLIPLAFTHEFAPVQPLLEWLLLASLVRLCGSTLTYAVLARCPSGTFFALEFAGGAALLGVSVAAMPVWGLAGLGVAALVAATVHYGLAWVVLRRVLILRWSGPNRRWMTLALLIGIGLQALALSPLADARQPVALMLALLTAKAALELARGLLGARRRVPNGE